MNESLTQALRGVLRPRSRLALAAAGTLLFAGCRATLPPIETVDYVDLKRFMGDWYVIANIPTYFEKGAHNAVESYRLDEDGSIATTFTFRDGGFEGPEKTYHPRGFVRDEQSNAEWGMQFVWPFRGDYRISYLDADYSLTVVTRNKRDYVWVMARKPRISSEDFARAREHIESVGYDLDELQKVPQMWPEDS